jgi:23S rRNA pseudouridine2605 synthase
LNRYLALLGIGSRRACDEIILSGRVTVNNQLIKTPGLQVLPGETTITVDGRPVAGIRKPIILILNKPEGVVSTTSDPQNRPTVVDLCKQQAAGQRLFPVGRLDTNTTGAILLTNDGLLCYRLTHPRFQIPRTYLARVRGVASEDKLAKLNQKSGIHHSSHDKSPKRPTVNLVKTIKRESILRVTLYEGKNRQVRRMCEAVGLNIVSLKRIRFGPLTIRKLPLGAARPLSKEEIASLKKITQ